MPAPVPTEPRNPQLLTVLFWVGVALAPVAALILLVADGNGPLRFAAVLAITAVVLIGLSIALRTEGGGQLHAEELRKEIDELRRELRGEIVAAAQRGNQALDEAQRVQAALGGLRRRVDAGATGPTGPTGGEEPPGAGRARVPAPEPEVPARHAERPAGSAGVYRTPPAGGVAGDRPATGSAGVYGSAARPEHDNRSADPAPRPLGVVRHTETVHVTTRHTIVDGGVGEPGTRYGGYPAEQERSWSDSRGERAWSDQPEDWSTQPDDLAAHWADQPARPGERAAHRDERDWGTPRDERGWPDGGQHWESPAGQSPSGGSHRAGDTGEYWAQLRAGDRWAAVRDDDRGRELRVGERHAEVHADHTGSAYRVQDRWASVRRDEPRRDADDEGWRHGWGEPEARPALPAGGVPVPQEWQPPRQRGYQPEPTRGQGPEPQPYGRRQHAGEPGYGHRAHDAGRWH